MKFDVINQHEYIFFEVITYFGKFTFIKFGKHINTTKIFIITISPLTYDTIAI